MRRVYELTINARPDANGRIWAMLQDRAGDHYAGHLGRYIEATSGGRTKAIVEARVFVGVVAESITGLIRAASEWCTGQAHAAEFVSADPVQFIDGAAGLEPGDVGPVLHFRLSREMD